MASCAPTGAIGDLGDHSPPRDRPISVSSTMGDSRPDSEGTNDDRTNTHLPNLPNADQVDGIAGGAAHRRHAQTVRGPTGPKRSRSRWWGSGHSRPAGADRRGERCHRRSSGRQGRTRARPHRGIAPRSVELCEASAAVNDVKRPSRFGQQRGCLFPFRSERQGLLVRPEVA
jgi:hypothetical protein